MAIATTLVSVVFASSLAAGAPAAAFLPPVVVDVIVASNVPPTVVTRVLDEADAIWRASGLTFVWRRTSAAGASPAQADACPPPHRNLGVVIGNDRGATSGEERARRVPLGWIVFEEQDMPDHEIYVSYENAVEYMAGARAVVGVIEQMPVAERELKLARAMGRALAHEIGHYLLASKAHSPKGLMQATHTANEFFGYPRDTFTIDAAQRQTVAARLQHASLTAVLHDVR